MFAAASVSLTMLIENPKGNADIHDSGLSKVIDLPNNPKNAEAFDDEQRELLVSLPDVVGYVLHLEVEGRAPDWEEGIQKSSISRSLKEKMLTVSEQV